MDDNVTYIPNRLKNAAKGGYVTGAVDIIDDSKNKNQQTINQERVQDVQTLDSKIDAETRRAKGVEQIHATELANRYTKEEVNNIVSRTPETDVIVIEVPAASQSDIAGWLDANTPSGIDPETGRNVRANKLYRVPGPDNTTYSEWAWDGTAYIMLANKDYGIDNIANLNSGNLMTSNGTLLTLNSHVKDFIPLKYINDNVDSNNIIGLCLFSLIIYNSYVEDNFVTTCVKALRNCTFTVNRLQNYSVIKYIHVFDSNFRQTEIIDVALENTINAVAGYYYVTSGKGNQFTIKCGTPGALVFYNIFDDFDKRFVRLDDLTSVSIQNFYILSTGGYNAANDWIVSDIIDIEGYSCIINRNHRNAAYYNFYDSEGSFISASNVFGVISIPPNAKYIQYCYNPAYSLSEYENGLYVLKDENQNHSYLKRVFNHVENTPIDYEGNAYTNKYITNLNSAVVGGLFVPSFDYIESFSSFVKYPVYKNAILRIVGKVGSTTTKFILTDKDNVVVKIVTGDPTRYEIAINVEKDGFLYCSLNKNSEYPTPRIVQMANISYGIDDDIIPGSDSLVKSSGVKDAMDSYITDYIPLIFINDTNEKNIAIGVSFWGMEAALSLPSNNFITVCVKALRNCTITIKRLQLYSTIKYIHVFDSNYRQTELIDIALVNTVNATKGCYYVFSGKAHQMTVKTDIYGSLKFLNYVDDFDKLFKKLDELTSASIPKHYINSVGGVGYAGDWNISDIIDISGYSLIINRSSWENVYYNFFDSDYNYISSSNLFGAIDVPVNAKYVQYCYNSGSGVTKNGLFVLIEEDQNLQYIKRTYNHVKKTYIDDDSNAYIGKWINNLNTATVGSPFVPNFSSLASYSSFSKYPVYKNSILRVIGKVGSATNKIIITDTQGFVVKIITLPLGDQIRLMTGINIEENGFLYASFQTNENWPRPFISQVANTFEAKESTSPLSYREPFYMRIRDNVSVKIGILGDSTTDGMGTSGFNRAVNGHEGSQWDNTYNGGGGTIGSTDYINQNAYPYLLEQLIKSESGNQSVRVYNMGWSGKTAKWALDNISLILGGAYSDVEIVGINYGINDSTELYQNTFYDVVEDYRKNICALIDYMHKKGIYVFLIKHQIVLKGMHETSKARTVNELNDVLDDIGRMYNIPVYDMTSFTKMFSYYSEYGYLTMFQDNLHGKDAIHNVEAGFLMGQICERVVKVSELNGDIIAYQGNNIIVADNIEISKGSSINNGFKEWVLQTNVTQNTLIGDLRIINDTKDPVDLYGFIGNSANTCKATVSKIKENDTEVQIVATDGVKITTLKVGEYASVIIRNNTTTADFLGFKIH